MSDYADLFTGAAPPPAANPQPAAAGKHYRLLFVDDEPNVLNALKRVFHRENYEVLTAASGEEALALLEKETVQLIVSDYMMPGIKGGELLQRVRALQPDTMRFMLTGHADMNAVLEAVKSGAVYRFILKPWNDDDLRLSVSLALEQSELRDKNRSLQRENADRTREIGQLAKLSVNNHSQLAIMLGKRGLLNPQQVQELFRLQQAHKEPVIRLLHDRDWVAAEKIHAIMVKELLFEEVALAEFQVDPAVAALVPKQICRRQWVVPLRVEARRLMLATADPLDDGLLADLRFLTGMEIRPVCARVAEITAKLNEIFGAEGDDVGDMNELMMDEDPYEGIQIVIDEDEDAAPIEDLLRATEEPPAIRLVNAIIVEAIRLRASDIHIHPRAKSVMVRYRIDGILLDKIQIPHALQQSLVSRLKVMAELDISERRRPQDGRITVKTALRMVDLRISTLPTINGEKVVMRLLERSAPVERLENLGFFPGVLAQIEHIVKKPQGIILATGPTGSGKTTTLYSLLQHDMDSGRNYLTVEDPVEYYLDAASQVLIREKIGLTFSSVLRSMLRQDPDVILLGEIRDLESAEVAFHAALTGHLVFSTLHTNSAAATLTRLFDMGLKPLIVATALEGIVAQRLARCICPHCREESDPDPDAFRALGLDPAGFGQGWHGRGCVHCHGTGYLGRIGLFEVLVMDDRLRDLIASGASVVEIRKHLHEIDVRGVLDDGAEKIRQGITTADEVLRILGPQ